MTRSFAVLRSPLRRALALLIGCVLAVSWIGSARAMCAMAPGHAMDAAMEHAMTMDAAMAVAHMASHSRGESPSDEGCPMHGRGNSQPPASHGTMPSDCAAAAHCTALTALMGAPTIVAPVATMAPMWSGADGPVLRALDSAIAPTVPPPRA